MSYQSTTIAAVIKRLNTQYFLPAIQREFVWKPDQIVQLFDSIMRGYPISSFLFWQLKPENKDKWEVYRFIQDFSERGTHNPATSTHGVADLTLVLDGQQRLTSLLVGLRGSYTSKRKYMHWDSDHAWVKQRLFLDLLKDPKSAEDDVEVGNRYGFRFSDHKPANDAQHYWFEVGKILDFDGHDAFDLFVDEVEAELPDTSTKGQVLVLRRNLRRLRESVWTNEIVAYYTEMDQDYDRVLDIFVRANEGGTKLSKSDLLLSMVTAKWGGMNARQEIYDFVGEINTQLTRKNDFDKDFVMKSCLVLSDLPVQYLVKNFNNQNLDHIRQNWPNIKKAMREGIDLINSFGIDRDTLTSTNALIPVLDFLFTHPNAKPQHGSSPNDAENATTIRRWLLMALLNSVFGRASDSTLNATRRIMREYKTEQIFPADAISAELAKSGRVTQFDDQTITNVLEIHYGERETFLALSMLYDENAWGTVDYHQDHIFPRSSFTPTKLEAAGITGATQEHYLRKVNSLANLELLSGHENSEKLNKPFDQCVATRDAKFKSRHLIPGDPTLLQFDHFEQFIAAREQLIRQRLTSLFAQVALAAANEAR